MIIDTEKLREKISEEMAERASIIDGNVKSDDAAMKLLTYIEETEQKFEEVIIKVEELAKSYI